MDFSNYKYFFVNGCSYTQGGGLEEPKIRDDSCRPIYEKYYNVTWNTRADVNWAKRLSEIINIPCINYAKCGASAHYVSRTTYDFIFKHWNEKDKFFIIIEKPSSDRFEIFDNETGEYFIVNSKYDKNTNKNIFLYATREYWNKNYIDNKYQEKFKIFFKNHCDPDKNFLSSEKSYIGLYSFCKLHNIKILLTERHYHHLDGFNDADFIYFDGDYRSISDYSEHNKMSIKDECAKVGIEYYDTHPGFFTHIEYAQKVAGFLGWKGKLDVNIKKKI